MTDEDVELVRAAWNAFARGDIATTTSVLDPNINWHGAGAGESETACHSRSDAAAFLRNAISDGVSAELLDIRDAGDRLVAIVQTHVPDDWEPVTEPHGELVSVRDGKVTEILVYPTVDDALVAAGLAPETTA